MARITAPKAPWLAVVAAVAACTQGPADPAPFTDAGLSSPSAARIPDAVAVSSDLPRPMTVPHIELESSWRFDVPSPPVRVESVRFDPSTPPHKIKERFELKEEGRLLVRVDVWANPDRLALLPWMEIHTSHLQKARMRPQQRLVGRTHVPAVIAEQPRSGQSHNIITAVFMIEGHAVAVTCADGESPAAVRAFETVLDTFGMEGAR